MVKAITTDLKNGDKVHILNDGTELIIKFDPIWEKYFNNKIYPCTGHEFEAEEYKTKE